MHGDWPRGGVDGRHSSLDTTGTLDRRQATASRASRSSLLSFSRFVVCPGTVTCNPLVSAGLCSSSSSFVSQGLVHLLDLRRLARTWYKIVFSLISFSGPFKPHALFSAHAPLLARHTSHTTSCTHHEALFPPRPRPRLHKHSFGPAIQPSTPVLIRQPIFQRS